MVQLADMKLSHWSIKEIPAFDRYRTGWIFLALVVLGIGVRIALIDSAGTVHDRQFRSHLIARALYFSSLDDIPQWRKDVAEASSRRQEVLEPPLTEYVVALGYKLLGRESVRMARMVPLLLWVAGAIPLFLLARRIGTIDEALYSTAYYLLVPAGVHMSLSLLPEALMLTMMLCSLLAIVRYTERPSISRLLFAASASAAAILLKPFIVFTILGAFFALQLRKMPSVWQLISKPVFLFCLISLLPGTLFYGYGLIVDDYLRWKIDSSFLPHLLWSAWFWIGWLISSAEAVGIAPMILALIGLLLIRESLPQRLLLGLVAGYVIFCIAFNYYTRFLPYYHAQLIVIVALALGPTVGRIVDLAKRACVARWDKSLLIATVLICLALNIYQTKMAEGVLRFEGEEVAAEIGEIVQHSTRVAYLAQHYGLPLEYYGELAGEYWPRARKGWPLVAGDEVPMGIDVRLSGLGFQPEYFVISDLSEYHNNHDDLKVFLEANASLIAESDQYLIYKLTGGRAGS